MWRALLVGALASNAVIGVAYRVYRRSKGGPKSDVIGQSILGLLLAAVAIGVAAEADWLRWASLGYGILFGAAVMPVWVLAVLIPLRPRAIDYAFTALYWAALVVIVVASLAL